MVEHHISFKTCVLSATSAGLRKQFFSDVLLSATQVQQFVCQLPAFPPHIQSCGFQRTAEVSHKNLKTPVEGWMIHGPAGLAQDHARPTTSRIRRNRQVGQRTIATHQDQQGGRLFLVTGTSLNLTKLSILPKANDWRAATEESHEHDCDATQGRCEQPFLQETMQSRWIDVNRWIRQFNAEDSVSKGDAQEVWDERMASNPTQDMISRTCSDWNRMPKMVSMWSVSDWNIPIWSKVLFVVGGLKRVPCTYKGGIQFWGINEIEDNTEAELVSQRSKFDDDMSMESHPLCWMIYPDINLHICLEVI